jgi:hypothetical protein
MTEKQPAAVAPADAMIAVLLDGKADDKAKREARKLASGIAAGRPWQSHPPRFKSAVRADVLALCGTGRPGVDAIVKAGYVDRVARQVLRDVGRY